MHRAMASNKIYMALLRNDSATKLATAATLAVFSGLFIKGTTSRKAQEGNLVQKNILFYLFKSALLIETEAYTE